MTYSHRNGETEPPTLDQQYFWFKATEDEDFGIQGIFFTLHGEAIGTIDEAVDLDELKGRWWGPVVPPWEQDLEQQRQLEDTAIRQARQEQDSEDIRLAAIREYDRWWAHAQGIMRNGT